MSAEPYGVSGAASGSMRTVAIRSVRPRTRSACMKAARVRGSSMRPIGPRGAYARCQPTTGTRRSRSCAPATGDSTDGPMARRTGVQPPMARTSPHSHSCGKAWYAADSTKAFHVAASVTRKARRSSLLTGWSTRRRQGRPARPLDRPTAACRRRRRCSSRGPCRQAAPRRLRAPSRWTARSPRADRR